MPSHSSDEHNRGSLDEHANHVCTTVISTCMADSKVVTEKMHFDKIILMGLPVLESHFLDLTGCSLGLLS